MKAKILIAICLLLLWNGSAIIYSYYGIKNIDFFGYGSLITILIPILTFIGIPILTFIGSYPLFKGFTEDGDVVQDAEWKERGDVLEERLFICSTYKADCWDGCYYADILIYGPPGDNRTQPSEMYTQCSLRCYNE